MKDLDIQVGDRVTYEGAFGVMFQELITESNEVYYIKDFEILKIERIGQNGWYTVYEKQADILDEKEKEYLKVVVRPFKNRIRNITKMTNIDRSLEYINIVINSVSSYSNREDLYFPYFKKNTMYKNMKANKRYTLKELGLEE